MEPTDPAASPTGSARQRAQLARLRTLMDVVFALMIWRFASYLPRPEEADWTPASAAEFLLEHIEVFEVVVVGVGVVMVVVYWLQNNAPFGNLSHTDNRHTAFAIVQVFLLLVYGYAINLGVAFEGDAGTLVLQSVSAAALGFVAVAGWTYAMRARRLLDTEISDSEARDLRVSTLAEPVTALVTLLAIPFGSTAWSLSWLLYPLLRRIFGRRLGGP